MAFDAKVYRVLIASPGDVDEERKAIPEIIQRWNDLNAEQSNVVLMPVKWETNSAPLMGDRPQGVINRQVVESCDMAIGVFWTRLGSPTGANISGSAEEIDWFIENGRPAMVYFSARPITPANINIEQYAALKKFEARMQKIGLTGSYTSLPDLKEMLLNQLTINLRDIISGNAGKTAAVVPLKEKVAAIKKISKEGQVYMEDYEKDGVVKSFVVKGDTKSIKGDLKAMRGRWNQTLGGWVFPKTREIELAEFLKISRN